MTLRPFRFSSPVSGVSDRSELHERVRMLDDLGYSTATMSDHFNEQLGPIAALMAIAEASSRLRIGSLVFCNDYRHPVALAKEAATLDVLSEGRLELGLGAGWREEDYAQSGIPLDRPGVRIARLAESLTVLKGLWGEGPVEHRGANYEVSGLDGMPKPLQRPHPPIIVGGGGRKVLELAAREADIVGLLPRMTAGRIDASAGASATPAATDEKLAWIREAAGERFGDLELHVRLEFAFVVDDPDPLFEAVGSGFGLTVDEARRTPHALAGPTEAMIDHLIERRERWGISYIGIPYESAEAMGPVVGSSSAPSAASGTSALSSNGTSGHAEPLAR